MLFLYRHVLGIEIGAVPSVVRARTPERLPVVLSREEIAAILKQLTGTIHQIAGRPGFLVESLSILRVAAGNGDGTRPELRRRQPVY